MSAPCGVSAVWGSWPSGRRPGCPQPSPSPGLYSMRRMSLSGQRQHCKHTHGQNVNFSMYTCNNLVHIQHSTLERLCCVCACEGRGIATVLQGAVKMSQGRREQFFWEVFSCDLLAATISPDTHQHTRLPENIFMWNTNTKNTSWFFFFSFFTGNKGQKSNTLSEGVQVSLTCSAQWWDGCQTAAVVSAPQQ